MKSNCHPNPCENGGTCIDKYYYLDGVPDPDTPAIEDNAAVPTQRYPMPHGIKHTSQYISMHTMVDPDMPQTVKANDMSAGSFGHFEVFRRNEVEKLNSSSSNLLEQYFLKEGDGLNEFNSSFAEMNNVLENNNRTLNKRSYINHRKHFSKRKLKKMNDYSDQKVYQNSNVKTNGKRSKKHKKISENNKYNKRRTLVKKLLKRSTPDSKILTDIFNNFIDKEKHKYIKPMNLLNQDNITFNENFGELQYSKKKKRATEPVLPINVNRNDLDFYGFACICPIRFKGLKCEGNNISSVMRQKVNLKNEVTRKQSVPNFSKNEQILRLRVRVCIKGQQMFVISKNLECFFSCYLRLEILLFAYYRQFVAFNLYFIFVKFSKRNQESRNQ